MQGTVPTNAPEGCRGRSGLWSSVALVVGITIGSGIFRSPAGIARQVPNPMLMLGLWVVGGAHHAVRRAVAGRARGGAAGNRRLLRLPARGLGPLRGLSLRLVRARADPRVGARRHRRRVRRIPAAQHRRRSGRALRRRARAVGRRHRLRRRAPTSSAPIVGAAIVGRRRPGAEVLGAGAAGRRGVRARRRPRRAAWRT